MGSASILNIQADVDIYSNPYPQVEEISQILPSEVGGRPLIDMHVSHSSSEALALVLNDHGSLYECSFGQGSRTVYGIPISIPNCTKNLKVIRDMSTLTL
jgi:hypothetical protein